jgi:hypothetical protein
VHELLSVSISGAPWNAALSEPSPSRFDISSASMRSLAFRKASRPRTLQKTTRGLTDQQVVQPLLLRAFLEGDVDSRPGAQHALGRSNSESGKVA